MADSVEGAQDSAATAVALTAGERRAFRCGVLAAGAIFLDGAKYGCGCHERIDNLRIRIAARGLECEAPGHWAQRSGA